VTSHRSVFLDKVLIARPNITYGNSAMVFYCKVHVSGVQIIHHQVDVGYKK